MIRLCVAVSLLASSVAALAQPVPRGAANPFPGAFGVAVGQPIDPARMAELGFVEAREGGRSIWRRRRPGEFFQLVEVVPLTTNIIISIEGVATFSRPAGTPDTRPSRAALMALCRPALAATAGAWFAGFPRQVDSDNFVYISERMNRRGATELGAQTASLRCTQDEASGDILFSMLLTRLPRPAR